MSSEIDPQWVDWLIDQSSIAVFSDTQDDRGVAEVLRRLDNERLMDDLDPMPDEDIPALDTYVVDPIGTGWSIACERSAPDQQRRQTMDDPATWHK